MGISNCRVGEVYYSAGPQLTYEILAVSPTPEAGDVYVYFCKFTDLIDNEVYFTTIWDNFPDSDEWVLLPYSDQIYMDALPEAPIDEDVESFLAERGYFFENYGEWCTKSDWV